jgi:hypothetical protein
MEIPAIGSKVYPATIISIPTNSLRKVAIISPARVIIIARIANSPLP